mmetsp:Transcript_28547/g.46776  ORF Transcript_28547/g.46776 Transcript_28547/m.46776 type:complete len:100 (+) Transcript_28547:1263-1562(+)
MMASSKKEYSFVDVVGVAAGLSEVLVVDGGDDVSLSMELVICSEIFGICIIGRFFPMQLLFVNGDGENPNASTFTLVPIVARYTERTINNIGFMCAFLH